MLDRIRKSRSRGRVQVDAHRSSGGPDIESLYGANPSHIRYAAGKYATESRRLLESFLPTDSGRAPWHRQPSGVNLEEVTNRAFLYAAESRRLLWMAEALEKNAPYAAHDDNSPSAYRPPQHNGNAGDKFPFALNLSTTELTPEDAAAAAEFVHYARLVQDGRQNCAPAMRGIMAGILPDRNGSTRKSAVGGRGVAKKLFLALLGICALLVIIFVAGKSIQGWRSANKANASVSESNESFWTTADAPEPTAVPTASPTGEPTKEPTKEPTPTPTQTLTAMETSVPTSDTGAYATYSSESPLTRLRHNPWAWAGLGSFLAILLVVTMVAYRHLLHKDSSSPDLLPDPSLARRSLNDLEPPLVGSSVGSDLGIA